MDIIYLPALSLFFPKSLCFGICLSRWRHSSNVKWLSHNSWLLVLSTQMGLVCWWDLLWGHQAGIHLLHCRAPKYNFSWDVTFSSKDNPPISFLAFPGPSAGIRLNSFKFRIDFHLMAIFFWKKFLEVKLGYPRVTVLKFGRFQCNFGSIQRKKFNVV